MQIIDTSLIGLKIIKPASFQDERGWFSRLYDDDVFRQQNFPAHWKQINYSFTRLKGTIRGLHFQNPPFEEVKMIKCLKGRIYDVAVDIRKDSATYLQSFSIELRDDENVLFLIPEGFAHGFQTLQDDCALMYFHSQAYTPGSEGGFRYNDPAIGIEWPLEVSKISERDSAHPFITKL